MKGLAFLVFICFSWLGKGYSFFSDSINKTNSYLPGITLENPLNSGRLGLIVPGLTVQNITRLSKEIDGNAGIYVGLGEPKKYVGAGATINVYGLSNKIGEQKNIGTGSLNLHVNKLLFANRLLLDAGVDNVILWGNYFDRSYVGHRRSYYISSNYIVYFSKTSVDRPFNSLSITGGMGNGYFRSDKNIRNNRTAGFDPFLSLATPIIRGTNFIAEWNGYDFGVGISSIPFQKVPFMLQLELTDIKFGTPRFVSSLSFPFSIKKRGAILEPMRIRAIRPVRTI